MAGAHVEIRGEVIEVAKDGFKIQMQDSEQVVFAKLSGKLRKNKIRILLGDQVTVKVSPYDLTLGFITKRY